MAEAGTKFSKPATSILTAMKSLLTIAGLWPHHTAGHCQSGGNLVETGLPARFVDRAIGRAGDGDDADQLAIDENWEGAAKEDGRVTFDQLSQLRVGFCQFPGV